MQKGSSSSPTFNVNFMAGFGMFLGAIYNAIEQDFFGLGIFVLLFTTFVILGIVKHHS